MHKGASNQSYGLAVARFARLPPEVIEAAAKRMAELEAQEGACAAAAGGGGASEAPAPAAAVAAAGGGDGSGDAAARELLLKFAGLPLQAGMAPADLAAALREHAIELCQ